MKLKALALIAVVSAVVSFVPGVHAQGVNTPFHIDIPPVHVEIPPIPPIPRFAPIEPFFAEPVPSNFAYTFPNPATPFTPFGSPVDPELSLRQEILRVLLQNDPERAIGIAADRLK